MAFKRHLWIVVTTLLSFNFLCYAKNDDDRKYSYADTAGSLIKEGAEIGPQALASKAVDLIKDVAEDELGNLPELLSFVSGSSEVMTAGDLVEKGLEQIVESADRSLKDAVLGDENLPGNRKEGGVIKKVFSGIFGKKQNDDVDKEDYETNTSSDKSDPDPNDGSGTDADIDDAKDDLEFENGPDVGDANITMSNSTPPVATAEIGADADIATEIKKYEEEERVEDDNVANTVPLGGEDNSGNNSSENTTNNSDGS